MPGAHLVKQPPFTVPILPGKQEESCVQDKYSVPVWGLQELGGNGFWARGCNLKTRLVVTKQSLGCKVQHGVYAILL